MCARFAIGKYPLPHTNQTLLANVDGLPHTGIAADKSPSANMNAAVDDSRRGDMAVVCYHGIVLDQRFAVNDAVATHRRAGIDHRAVHDDGAGAQCGVRRDVSAW